MIIFAVTKEGFLDLEPVIKSAKCPVWVGGSVLTEEELVSYRVLGVDITNFNYVIDPGNNKELDGALVTISEHHPDERVWLECKS